jgi:hypothetical protein
MQPPKLSLGTRLFLSHLLVMVVGLSSFIIIAKLSSPRMFVRKAGIFYRAISENFLG